MQAKTISTLIASEAKAIEDYSAFLGSQDLSAKDRRIIAHILQDEQEHLKLLQDMARRHAAKGGKADGR
ncbi:MAG: hypothetical protein IMW95_09080 [Moorella humiferrea]|nr:hypothetical protein [Moorella humiferrea]